MRLPTDTDTTIYILEESIYNLNELIIKAQEKWGEDVDISKIRITIEHIQVDHFYYDQYDPSDWRNFYFLEKEL